jgi:drug/metabolite transporter (DMT)-like permease
MNIDQVVLILILLGTVGAAVMIRQRGARGRRWFGASALAFFGVVVTAMMGAHTVETSYHLVVGDIRLNGKPWAYDFHFYALQLISAVLIWQGVRALALAGTVARASASRRRDVIGPVLVTLGVCIPLIPVHAFFGVMYTVLSALVLLVVASAMPRQSA